MKRLAGRSARRELQLMGQEFCGLPERETSYYENDPRRQWVASAREFVELIQGPAREAAFSASEDLGRAATDLADNLITDRLPSWPTVRRAVTTRRKQAMRWKIHRQEVNALFEAERRQASRG